MDACYSGPSTRTIIDVNNMNKKYDPYTELQARIPSSGDLWQSTDQAHIIRKSYKELGSKELLPTKLGSLWCRLHRRPDGVNITPRADPVHRWSRWYIVPSEMRHLSRTPTSLITNFQKWSQNNMPTVSSKSRLMIFIGTSIVILRV